MGSSDKEANVIEHFKSLLIRLFGLKTRQKEPWARAQDGAKYGKAESSLQIEQRLDVCMSMDPHGEGQS